MTRCFALLLAILMTRVSHAEMHLEHVWSIEGKFNMPESAAYDPKRRAVYVSNVNHYAKDSNGFISRVDTDNQSLDLHWLTGLHSPTGLAVHGDMLYAVDYDALVVIDLNRSEILYRASAPDADARPVLNDVAVAGDGKVFVSGSASRKIYQLNNRKLSVWLHAPQALETANGLRVHGNALLHGGLSFTVFDLNSTKTIDGMSKMGTGLTDIDGIAPDGKGGFMVSLIDDARLWSIGPGRAPRPLSQQRVEGIDMHYDVQQNLLFLPRVGGTLSVYRLSSQHNPNP